jgi:hypothetical protein
VAWSSNVVPARPATFGASVNLQSREVSAQQSISPFAANGTWNTKLIGTRVDPGTLTDLGDARIAFTIQSVFGAINPIRRPCRHASMHCLRAMLIYGTGQLCQCAS